MPQSPTDIQTHKIAEAPEVKEKTIGEKRFNRIVYDGMAGVGTFIITLPLAYHAEYGKSAAFNKLIGKLETVGLTHGTSKNIMKTLALGLGGTVMLIPLRIAEVFHKPLVERLSPTAEDKAQAAENLKSNPPQTWSSLLEGRVTAAGTVLASITGVNYLAGKLGHKDALPKFEEAFADRFVKWIGKPSHTEEIVDGALAKVETKAYRYGKLAALDIFATAAATILLDKGSHFFARRKVEKEMEQEERFHTTHPELRDEAPSEILPVTQVGGAKSIEGLLADTKQATQTI